MRRRTCISSALHALLLLGVALVVDGQRFASKSKARKLAQAASAASSETPRPQSCPAGPYIQTGSTRQSIFDQLTIAEYNSVVDFMVNETGFIFPAAENRDVHINVVDSGMPVSGDAAYLTENYLYNVFLWPVDKAEALAYLDSGGPVPARYAKVIAVRGANSPPDVMEYKVGPLPIGPDSAYVEQYPDGHIAWVKRPGDDLGDSGAMPDVIDDAAAILKPVFNATIGQCYSNSDPDCTSSNISSFWTPPQTRENGTNRVVVNLFFFSSEWAGASDELQVMPIAWKTEMTSQDPTEWYNFEFEYCNQGFNTAQELADALSNGTLRVCNPQEWTTLNYNDNWLADKYQGGPRADSTKAGPRLYEPEGKRYTLLQGDSASARVFQYMDWQAHVTVDPWTGLSLHDVNFKGNRIAYELGVQGQFVAYSGYSSIGQLFYFDDAYQLGSASYQLRPGVDCPETASYMDIEMMGEFGYLIRSKGAVCFFEDWTLGTTTWRHTDILQDDTLRDSGVRNYEFVVRTIATVGNYDYMYDIRFALDGAITCRIYQAGYMQAAYWDPAGGTKMDLPYGTVVHTYTLGNIHDHLSGWKVDLDVMGQSNCFHKATLAAGTFEEVFGPGKTPMWARPTDVVKYQRDQLIANETGFNLGSTGQSTFLITNDNELNSWNQTKGYAIVHTGATASQLLPDTHPLVVAQSWTKYHMAVTQRKEAEPVVSKDYYDTHSPGVSPIPE
uniref:Amine oxidase n=1 Tax=Trebouxia lynnae TaxID=1825957 RepID=A0A7L9QEI5_9CHLO|nr:putative extracellular protein TR9_033 [Trebouxia lynnae]